MGIAEAAKGAVGEEVCHRVPGRFDLDSLGQAGPCLPEITLHPEGRGEEKMHIS